MILVMVKIPQNNEVALGISVRNEIVANVSASDALFLSSGDHPGMSLLQRFFMDPILLDRADWLEKPLVPKTN